TPGLAVASWVGWLLPLSPPQLFAGLTGAMHALDAPLIYALVRAGHGSTAAYGRALAFVVALMSAVNGVALASIGFPHFEVAISSLTIAFFALRALGHKRLSLVAFAACLMVREDAGLYPATLLGLVITIESLAKGSWRVARADLILIVIALAYVALAIA